MLAQPGFSYATTTVRPPDPSKPLTLVETLHASATSPADVNELGYTPLHVASASGSDESIFVLLAAADDTASSPSMSSSASSSPSAVPSIDGRTPLSIACGMNRSMTVIRALLRYDPGQASIVDARGHTATFYFFLRIQGRVLEFYRRSKFFGLKICGTRNNTMKEIYDTASLFLKAECFGDDRAAGTSTSVKGAKVWNMVHAAVTVESCTAAFTLLVLKNNPLDCRRSDASGRHALHLAVAADRTTSLDKKKSRLLKCSTCCRYARREDRFLWYFPVQTGISPIRILCAHCHKREHHPAPQDSVSYYPDIHAIPKPLAVIRYLLSWKPQLACIPDGNGRLPLHCAVSNGKGWHRGVQELCEAAPDGLRSRDPVSLMHPFMMMAAASASSSSSNGGGTHGNENCSPTTLCGRGAHEACSSSDGSSVLQTGSSECTAESCGGVHYKRRRVIASSSSRNLEKKRADAASRLSTVYELLIRDPTLVRLGL